MVDSRWYSARLRTLLASGVRWLPYVIAVVLAVISTLTNIGVGRHFVGYDAGLSLMAPLTDSKQLNVWNVLYAPGSPSPLAPMATLWVGGSALLVQLGISSLMLER